MSEARHELRHVNWPTRQEAMRLTAIVIGIALGLALFLGLFDFIFADIIRNIVSSSPGSFAPSDIILQEEAPLDLENVEIETNEGAMSGEAAGIEIEPLNINQ